MSSMSESKQCETILLHGQIMESENNRNLISHGICTTAGWFFAECLMHSAKAKLHSAKPLPSATLGKELRRRC